VVTGRTRYQGFSCALPNRVLIHKTVSDTGTHTYTTVRRTQALCALRRARAPPYSTVRSCAQHSAHSRAAPGARASRLSGHTQRRTTTSQHSPRQRHHRSAVRAGPSHNPHGAQEPHTHDSTGTTHGAHTHRGATRRGRSPPSLSSILRRSMVCTLSLHAPPRGNARRRPGRARLRSCRPTSPPRRPPCSGRRHQQSWLGSTRRGQLRRSSCPTNYPAARSPAGCR